MGDHDTRALPPGLAAFSIALCAEGGDADGESWAQIWPASEDGIVRGRDGREFQQGELAEIVKLTELPLLLDVDHESEFGFSTIASGWFEQLDVRDDGIWGRLEATSKGASLIESKSFRMLSPVVRLAFDAPETDGDPDPLPRAIGLSSVALTNRPNLRMTALNRAETVANATTEEAMTDEELAELRALLELPDDADGAALLEAVKAALMPAEEDLPADPPDAENARLSSEVTTLRASLGIITEQRDKLAAHAAEAKLGDAKARVDLAIREGRANPSHRSTLETLAAGDDDARAMFASLTSTVTGPPTKRVKQAANGAGSTLTKEELTEKQLFQFNTYRGLKWSASKALARITRDAVEG